MATTAPINLTIPKPAPSLPPNQPVSIGAQGGGGTTPQTSQDTSVTPEGLIPLSWYATPTASQTDIAMNRAGVAAALALLVPFRGSVVAITLSGTAAKSAGTATFEVRKNGSKLSGCSLTWGNVQRQAQRFNKGVFGFARDDYLDIVFTTNSAYTPTTTVIDVTIWVTQDSQEAI